MFSISGIVDEGVVLHHKRIHTKSINSSTPGHNGKIYIKSIISFVAVYKRIDVGRGSKKWKQFQTLQHNVLEERKKWETF